MTTAQKILAPILILATLIMALPIQARPLVECDLTLDRTVLPAGQSQKTVIKVNLDVPAIPIEVERPPVNLTLVLDRSGSMSGQKIEKAKEAAITALRRLGPQDIFSLVIYDHTVQTIVAPQSASNTESMTPSRVRGLAMDAVSN